MMGTVLSNRFFFSEEVYCIIAVVIIFFGISLLTIIAIRLIYQFMNVFFEIRHTLSPYFKYCKSSSLLNISSIFLYS